MISEEFFLYDILPSRLDRIQRSYIPFDSPESALQNGVWKYTAHYTFVNKVLEKYDVTENFEEDFITYFNQMTI